MIGSRLGHMGLTGEQGAQTEGKTTTQHHCWVSVDCVVLKHCSPKDKKDRSKHKETPRHLKHKASKGYMLTTDIAS